MIETMTMITITAPATRDESDLFLFYPSRQLYFLDVSFCRPVTFSGNTCLDKTHSRDGGMTRRARQRITRSILPHPSVPSRQELKEFLDKTRGAQDLWNKKCEMAVVVPITLNRYERLRELIFWKNIFSLLYPNYILAICHGLTILTLQKITLEFSGIRKDESYALPYLCLIRNANINIKSCHSL